MADDPGDHRRQTPVSVALYWGEDEFLLREAAHELLATHGAHADEVAGPDAAALVGAVGESPAELAQAVEQLGSAFAGQAVGPEQIRAQFRGLGDQQVWDLCDHALAGRLGAALVTLRALLEDREAGLLILGGVAARVRDLIRVRSLPDRMPAVDAARAAGLRFDWQVKRYREQAGRFSMDEL